MTEQPTDEGRRSFRRTAGLGLPLAALATVASAKPWRGGSTGGGDASLTALDVGQRYPLASAVSLVLLAAWGVLLVTRGGVRRGFALVALVASVGLVACVVAGYVTLPDAAATTVEQLRGRSAADRAWSGWFWTAAVCAVLSVGPAALAVRRVATWPEMGRRYDAPGTAAAAPVAVSPDEPRTERDLWDQLDEGRDPTDPA